ncbi:hypothetical protein [Granulicella tundricola]|uniref:Uncharacterized protein n=1 Tax=Granulicella tundricola (strain ATCC BAA-1859 / DSM 23138 / MP5ACTX9) TaxID=1198114 RepID=E8X829_GRATM|nr:hypothetical protein [Granulicella tundricola]ADW71613.1 hypothetical protein AciX9_4684 [Granulicella tundricola MP5ACTX9]
MRECWAASLGNCRGGISREHVVSQCLFSSGSITVKGLDWCAGEAKTIGIQGLTRNILCEGHNSDLSPLDAVALQTFDSFDSAIKLRDFRQQYSPKINWTLRTFDIDGKLLERWFLKTLINITLDKTWIIGTGERELGKPSIELIEIAFGLRGFSPNEGLLVSAHVGYTGDLRQGLSFTPLTEGGNLVAGRFSFACLQFLLNLSPHHLRFDGTSQLLHHLRWIYFAMTDSRKRSKQSHRIRFSW